MGPTQATTEAEWKVLRWFFLILGVVALTYMWRRKGVGSRFQMNNGA